MLGDAARRLQAAFARCRLDAEIELRHRWSASLRHLRLDVRSQRSTLKTEFTTAGLVAASHQRLSRVCNCRGAWTHLQLLSHGYRSEGEITPALGISRPTEGAIGHPFYCIHTSNQARILAVQRPTTIDAPGANFQRCPDRSGLFTTWSRGHRRGTTWIRFSNRLCP